jgi:hypothetical protein
VPCHRVTLPGHTCSYGRADGQEIVHVPCHGTWECSQMESRHAAGANACFLGVHVCPMSGWSCKCEVGGRVQKKNHPLTVRPHASARCAARIRAANDRAAVDRVTRGRRLASRATEWESAIGLAWGWQAERGARAVRGQAVCVHTPASARSRHSKPVV